MESLIAADGTAHRLILQHCLAPLWTVWKAFWAPAMESCAYGPIQDSFVCMLQADAQTLGLLLLIQDILIAGDRDSKHPCHVVTTVRRPQTIEVSSFMPSCECCYIMGLGLVQV